MMESVGVYEAKTHLPRLLERVSRGERITITKHGVPVAVLQPPDNVITSDPEEVIAELKEFRSHHQLSGLSLKEMIEQGRR
jgi:prevent-host-death family protein